MLIVERLRLETFNKTSDLLVAGLEHRTIAGMIEVPNAAEIGAMLIRFKNRYDLAGNAETRALPERPVASRQKTPLPPFLQKPVYGRVGSIAQ